MTSIKRLISEQGPKKSLPLIVGSLSPSLRKNANFAIWGHQCVALPRDRIIYPTERRPRFLFAVHNTYHRLITQYGGKLVDLDRQIQQQLATHAIDAIKPVNLELLHRRIEQAKTVIAQSRVSRFWNFFTGINRFLDSQLQIIENNKAQLHHYEAVSYARALALLTGNHDGKKISVENFKAITQQQEFSTWMWLKDSLATRVHANFKQLPSSQLREIVMREKILCLLTENQQRVTTAKADKTAQEVKLTNSKTNYKLRKLDKQLEEQIQQQAIQNNSELSDFSSSSSPPPSPSSTGPSSTASSTSHEVYELREYVDWVQYRLNEHEKQLKTLCEKKEHQFKADSSFSSLNSSTDFSEASFLTPVKPRHSQDSNDSFNSLDSSFYSSNGSPGFFIDFGNQTDSPRKQVVTPVRRHSFSGYPI